MEKTPDDTSRQTLLLITDDNRHQLKMHALRSLAQLQKSLLRLREDLVHNSKEIRENSIVMAAAICMGVEEGIKTATEQLRKNKRE